MTFTTLADFKGRLAQLHDAAARAFAVLRLAARERLAAARDAVTGLARRAAETARGLASREGSATGHPASDVVGRVRSALAAPGAPAAAARAYLGLWAFMLVASLTGAPAALVALLSVAQGALKLALAAAVVAPLFGPVHEMVAAGDWLHDLRVGAAVGLLWLAGVSFALGQAVYPRPAVEAAAPAPADRLTVPPVVAAVTTPNPPPARGAGERPSRPRRRAAAPAGLA